MRNEKLSAEVERELIVSWRNGNRAAFEQLVEANLYLVQQIANLFYRSYKKVDIQDIISEGKIGLLLGLEKFDLNVGTRLSTYLPFWIRCQMTRYVVNNTSPIKVGTTREGRKVFLILLGQSEILKKKEN